MFGLCVFAVLLLRFCLSFRLSCFLFLRFVFALLFVFYLSFKDSTGAGLIHMFFIFLIRFFNCVACLSCHFSFSFQATLTALKVEFIRFLFFCSFHCVQFSFVLPLCLFFFMFDRSFKDSVGEG